MSLIPVTSQSLESINDALERVKQKLRKPKYNLIF